MPMRPTQKPKSIADAEASNVPTPILWHRLSEENRIGQDSKLGPYEKGNPFSDFTKMISSLKSVVAEMNVVKPLEKRCANASRDIRRMKLLNLVIADSSFVSQYRLRDVTEFSTRVRQYRDEKLFPLLSLRLSSESFYSVGSIVNVLYPEL
ncbi:hypothetical protein HZH68_001148 [Vespula germanica]|uniref:Uncharacterized protein n=1 Tax=Vespula germanica TaxID=30212 RepID=A0A834NUW9_VESGE|nr:hypothetical protein HZH68_001148 [Vespula germanica]